MNTIYKKNALKELEGSSKWCGIMPKSGYFINSHDRQEPIYESELNVEDNLEKFGYIADNELIYWENRIN